MYGTRTLSYRVQVALVRTSGYMHGKWYAAQYPDVAATGLSTAEHYLRIGADLGRNPSAGFDTRFYLGTYPETARSGMNPLLHYLQIGRARGYRTEPAKERYLGVLRTRLLSLGFTEPALNDLKALAGDDAASAAIRAAAAREVALWSMREGGAAGHAQALDWLGRARELASSDAEADGTDATDPQFRARLTLAELLCHHYLGELAQGLAVYERSAMAGEAIPDVMLARATLAADPEARLAWINAVLEGYDVPPLTLHAGDAALPAYDRLTTAAALPPVTDGPKVSVLLAAHDAGHHIGTALRALQEQTWRNLEILVIDDCSADETGAVVERIARTDPRIRLLRMETNGGAYLARNRGLAEATGDFVTLHDADDWAHPLRIEAQMRHLASLPEAIGCLSLQARMRDDLRFTRWTGTGQFIITNAASFLFRREPVVRAFGGWDRVRVSADNELIRRIRHVHGRKAVAQLDSLLALQRDSGDSAIADEFLGINGFHYGARRAYAEAQRHHRDRGGGMCYDTAARPFPVPAILRPDRPAPGRHVPVVLGSEFRMRGGSVNSCIEEIRFHRRHGLRLGLVEMFRYDADEAVRRTQMLETVRDQIDGQIVEQIVYGEHVRCDLLLLRYPSILQHPQRYIPRIEAREIKVIVNQPPMSVYGAHGVVRYDIARCAGNLRRWLGKDATWHPIGPTVRAALRRHHADALRHVTLSDEDWHNIIDIADWQSTPRRQARLGRLRIGRHARDSAHKWPDRAADILAAWPEAPDIEVHVLGGAQTPRALLGRLPGNWIVHEFDARDPRDFLADLDVWIYFPHPDWVESFGRTVIEAMAAGVPVILPESFRAQFADAALYATPATAIGIARALHADRAAHAAQVAKARAFVAARFSHASHARRLQALGIG